MLTKLITKFRKKNKSYSTLTFGVTKDLKVLSIIFKKFLKYNTITVIMMTDRYLNKQQFFVKKL